MRISLRTALALALASSTSLAACGSQTSDTSEKWVITNERYDGAMAVNTASVSLAQDAVHLEIAAYEDPESSSPPRDIPGGTTGPVMLINGVIHCVDKTLTIQQARYADKQGAITAIIPSSEISNASPMLYGGGDQPYDLAIDLACTSEGRAKLTRGNGVDRKGLYDLLQSAAKRAWEQE